MPQVSRHPSQPGAYRFDTNLNVPAGKTGILVTAANDGEYRPETASACSEMVLRTTSFPQGNQ
jgi:hypothetical protein